MPVTTLATLPAKTIFPGITARFAHLESRLTIGEVELAAGAVVPVHQHPHDQLTYLLAGRAECTVGGETHTLSAGMCVLTPGGTAHTFRALTACRALDVFTPVREDFR
jgi:quercetin dioxygenase-like cupin family protein